MSASGDDQLATIEIRRVEDTVHAIVRGEVDMSNAAEIQVTLRSACVDAARLVLDLSQLSFLDSHGIATIFELHRELSAHDQGFEVIARTGTTVARVLELTGMTQLMPVTLTEASTEKTIVISESTPPPPSPADPATGPTRRPRTDRWQGGVTGEHSASKR